MDPDAPQNHSDGSNEGSTAVPSPTTAVPSPTPAVPSPTPAVPPPGGSGASWTPPDAGLAAPARGRAEPGEVHVEVEDPDGPPLPPPVRRRRRRRRVLVGIAAALVVGVPVGLAVAGVLPGEDPPSATGTEDAREDGSAPEDDEGPDQGDGARDPAESGEQPEQLDVDALEGADAVYGQLLLDIEAAEQVMVGFQEEVAAVFADPAESPEQLIEVLREIGATRHEALLAARAPLERDLPEEGADSIRSLYLAHLDSWVEYMDAVAEDPSVLGGEGTGAGFTVVINATADAFARALDEELPADIDEEVRDYADALLDRGFRGLADAQV